MFESVCWALQTPGTFLPIGWGGVGLYGTFLVVLRWMWVVRTVRDS